MGDRTEQNKHLVLDYFRQVFGAQNPDAVRDFVAEDIRQHGEEIPDGVEAMEEFVRELAGAPSTRREPEFVVAEDDLVAICVAMPQPEPGDPGASYDYFLFETYRIRDGKLAERWPGTNKIVPLHIS